MKTLILIAFVLLFGSNFAPVKVYTTEKKELLVGTLFLSPDFHVTQDCYFYKNDKSLDIFLLRSNDLGFNLKLFELHLALFILFFVLSFACIFVLKAKRIDLSFAWFSFLSLITTSTIFISLFFASVVLGIGPVLPDLNFLVFNFIVFSLALYFSYRILLKSYFERFH